MPMGVVFYNILINFKHKLDGRFPKSGTIQNFLKLETVYSTHKIELGSNFLKSNQKYSQSALLPTGNK